MSIEAETFEDTKTRICATCGLRKPLTAFCRRRKNEPRRRSRCRTCRLEHDEQQRRKKRCAKMKRDLTRVSKARNIEECRAIATGMIEALGGMNRFVELFGRFACDDPGGASKWRVFSSLFQLLRCIYLAERELASDQSVARRQLENLSAGEAEELVQVLIEQNEPLVASRLRDLGWRVWRPGHKE